MDDTVGTMGLPVAPLILSVVFTWVFPRRELKEEMGGRRGTAALIIVAGRFVIPSVLLIVTITRIATRFDFQGWHWIPGIPCIGPLGQSITIAVLVVLFAMLFLLQRFKKMRS